MPWKVRPMSEIRFAFVHHVLTGGVPVAKACRRFHMSRKTGYKWLGRYRQAPDTPLVDRSRQPPRLAARTPPLIEQAVLQVRDRYGSGAAKIHAVLQPVMPDLPSERTLTRILRGAPGKNNLRSVGRETGMGAAPFGQLLPVGPVRAHLVDVRAGRVLPASAPGHVNDPLAIRAPRIGPPARGLVIRVVPGHLQNVV